MIFTSKISLAVAFPISTRVLLAVAPVLISSGTISTGFVVSTIVIICFPVETLPFSSVAIHVISVFPIGRATLLRNVTTLSVNA